MWTPGSARKACHSSSHLQMNIHTEEWLCVNYLHVFSCEKDKNDMWVDVGAHTVNFFLGFCINLFLSGFRPQTRIQQQAAHFHKAAPVLHSQAPHGVLAKYRGVVSVHTRLWVAVTHSTKIDVFTEIYRQSNCQICAHQLNGDKSGSQKSLEKNLWHKTKTSGQKSI